MSGYPEGRWLHLETPRVGPIERPALWQRVVLMLSRREAHSRDDLTVVATFLRLRRIFFQQLLLVSQLLRKGRQISLADKERIVMRVAWRMGNVYEWSHHLALGLSEGVSRQELESFCQDDCEHWSLRTRCFVECVDELIDTNTLSEDRWNRLRQELDEASAMEFTMLVGHYIMVAMTINSLGIQVEPQFEVGPLPRAQTPER